jgi:iron complex outermembrane receptor protein
LARQSNREIYFPADLTRGKRAPKVSGKHSVEDALRRLLSGSGLRFEIKPSGSIAIVKAGTYPSRTASPVRRKSMSEILQR